MGDTFPMNGGDDAYSYTKNSQIQKESSDYANGMIREAIMQELELKIPTTINIADLGCSVGPNTFSAVQNLIQSVLHKFHDHGLIDFQVFFNDHSANDFNTLFASLPADRDRQYYAAGVPGSFHGRLFPRGSITLAHSSFSLQWLSRVPEGVLNKGKIFYASEPRDEVVWSAHREQFERDTGEFMRARAEEIVKGGLMFLIIPATGNGVDHAHFLFTTAFNLLESSLTDLAAEGMIDKGEIDGFNFPVYSPSMGEMTKVIEENKCFSIERVEFTNPRSKVSARAIIVSLKAVFEGIFTQHFGDSVMEMVFTKTLAKAQVAPQMEMVEADLYHSAQLFYVLKRK